MYSFPSTPKIYTKPWACADGMRERAAARKGKNSVEAFITEAEGWGKERERGGKFEKPTRQECGALFGSKCLSERNGEFQSVPEGDWRWRGKGRDGWAFEPFLSSFYTPVSAKLTKPCTHHTHGRKVRAEAQVHADNGLGAPRGRGENNRQPLLTVGNVHNFPLCHRGREQQREPFVPIPHKGEKVFPL